MDKANSKLNFSILLVVLLVMGCQEPSIVDESVEDVGIKSDDLSASPDVVQDAVQDIGLKDDLSSTGPPNILLIIADDMGLDASPVHPEGAIKPNMPFLQGLSNRGITFENFWTNPTCTPTRATILTGKYGFNSGVLGVLPPNNGVSTSEVSLQSYLKSKTTYQSAVIGKWHLSTNRNGGADNPAMMGVEHYAGFLSGGHTDYSDWELTENGNMSDVKEYSTRYFTDLGIEWIQKQETKNPESPWFLWLAYTAPHSPFHLPPADLISATNLTGDDADIMANPLGYYHLMLEALDTEMGRLLETVDENTIIIFIGDNGSPSQVVQSPYSRRRAKGSVYQGGVNTPMVVAGRGVVGSGKREPAIINSTDLYATIADIAQTNITRIHDSRSFKGLLSNEPYTPRDYVYAEADSDIDVWAIRDDTYKLIVFEDGSKEFYNLIEDPYEADELISKGLNATQTAAKLSLEEFASSIRTSP